jgi:hypothetical protein
MEEQAVKFLKYSKSYDSVSKQNWKGIEQAWIFINPVKDQVLSDDLVVANIEIAAINAPDAFEFQVGIELACGYSVHAAGTPLVLAATRDFAIHLSVDRYHKELLAEIVARKTEIWNSFAVRTKYGDPYVDTLARYVLFHDTNNIGINNVLQGIDTTRVYVSDYSDNSYPVDISIPVLSISFTYSVNNFNIDSPIIKAIIADIGSGVISEETNWSGDSNYSTSIVTTFSSSNSEHTSNKVMSGASLVSGPSSYGFLGSWWYQEPSPTNPEIWVHSGNTWYLRKDFMKSGRLPNGGYIPLKARIELFSEQGFIDTKWRERSCDPWCSVAKIAIIIIAVVVAIYAPGMSGVVSTIAAVATAIIAFSLILTLAAMAAEGLGDPVLSRELSGFNQTISPLVKIAGIVLIVTTAIDVYNNFANAATVTTEELAIDATEQQLAASMAASNSGYVMSTFSTAASAQASVAERLIEKAISSTISSVTNISTKNLISNVSRLIDGWSKNELSTKANQLNRLNGEIAEQEAAIEEMRISDKGLEIIAMYANPVNNQCARVYSVFESPYEPTKMCSQATHVTALMGMGQETRFKSLLVGQTRDV